MSYRWRRPRRTEREASLRDERVPVLLLPLVVLADGLAEPASPGARASGSRQSFKDMLIIYNCINCSSSFFFATPFVNAHDDDLPRFASGYACNTTELTKDQSVQAARRRTSRPGNAASSSSSPSLLSECE